MENTKSTDDRIRDKAYELWEAEGHPHGRDQMHWDQAKEIIAITDNNETSMITLEASIRETVEPSIAFENQADLPDIADQGEAQPGPSWKAAADAAELPPEADAKPGKRATKTPAKPAAKRKSKADDNAAKL